MTKTKIYATSTVVSNTCMLPKDYSYATNAKCLDCKFCYKLTEDNKERLHLSRYIEEESKYSENLYLTPVLISRFCEPFLNQTYIRHSLFVAQNIIDNGGQVIFRTSGINLQNEDVSKFINNNSNNIQVQLRTFISHTKTGNKINEMICPDMPNVIQKILGVDTVLMIDPYIIGVNNFNAIEMVNRAIDVGITKIIIKQLFATEYFINYLSTMIDNKFISLLSEQVGKYKTYDNHALLSSILPLLEAIEGKADISFCMNKEINQIIGVKYNNCCMFENPVGVYDLSQNLMYRNKGCKITTFK